MFKVLGGAECSGVTVESRHLLPLTVTWQFSRLGGLLYLFVTGSEGGYVELKVDPDSGALYELIVITLPPETDRAVETAPSATGSRTPIFDVDMWEWKVTPDYKEPAKRDVDVTGPLSYSTPGGLLALWFSGAPVGRYLACGEVRVGVSASDELVNLVLPIPPTFDPESSTG